MTNGQPTWEHVLQEPQTTASIGWDVQQAFDKGSSFIIDRGGEIVTAGVSCKRVFQVKSGLAIRQRPLRDGAQAILDLYFPGDLIELDSLFFARPLDTVLALTRVSYRALDHAALNRLMQEPRIALQLMHHLVKEKQRGDTIALLLGHFKARERTAALLLLIWRRLKQTVGTANTDENEDSLPLTQKQLADYLGLDAIHLNRTLGALRNSGALRFRKGAIVVNNVTQLRHIAGRSEVRRITQKTPFN
jgi:CRP/FNR family transcriptional regulator, anaerobic regulatory protein